MLLAFLRDDLVVQLGWLTDRQLLDAIAVGQLTPGPVFTTATFVGYLVTGWAGPAVATAGIFLPSFLFVAASSPILQRARGSWWAAALLDGVNAAAVGLMAAVTIVLARDAVLDQPTLLIAVAAGGVLLATGLSSSWLVVGGAAVGLLIEFVIR